MCLPEQQIILFQIARPSQRTGLLASGATAKRAVEAFEVRSNEALRQVLGEVANRIDHRGRPWRHAMAEVERALEHIQSASELLEDSFRLARLSHPSGREAAAKLIDWSAQNLRKDFVAFRDGWTSPRSRPWRERNAAWYALLLILVGAIISPIVGWASKQLNDAWQNSAASANMPK